MLTLPFDHRLQRNRDTYSFYFSRGNVPFDFLPGQYIEMNLPHKNPDNRGISRYFTVSSSPTEKDYFMITTRVIQSSFKHALFALKKGTLVKFVSPTGNFTLKENIQKPHVFLSGGIGITPFHSMIVYASDRKLSVPITLFASFSTVEDVVFYDEFEKIAKDNSAIKIIYTITKPKESQKEWSGETGRISKELIKKYVRDTTKQLYFIAGPTAMVPALNDMLRDMDIPLEQIRIEDFNGY